MIEIRPIWERDSPAPAGLPDPVQRLTELGARSIRQLSLSVDAATHVHGEIVERIRPIIESANVDMVAGCELARCGYFKQAYSLWRSWLEQAMFALYFVESPLHLSAWKASEEIRMGTEPETKLMLHQLLVAGGERAHHFSVVYQERCEAVLRAWRVTPVRAADAIRIANSRLGDLSQGVHGTFRPQPIGSDAELPGEVTRHVLPVLTSGVRLVGFLWFVNIQSHLDLADEQLTQMRNAGFAPIPGEEEAVLLPLLNQLDDWLVEMREVQAR